MSNKTYPTSPKSLFHPDLLEKLFLGGNFGHVCSCRKLLLLFLFFCFVLVIWINFYIFAIMLGYSVKQY